MSQNLKKITQINLFTNKNGLTDLKNELTVTREETQKTQQGRGSKGVGDCHGVAKSCTQLSD